MFYMESPGVSPTSKVQTFQTEIAGNSHEKDTQYRIPIE